MNNGNLALTALQGVEGRLDLRQRPERGVARGDQPPDHGIRDAGVGRHPPEGEPRRHDASPERGGRFGDAAHADKFYALITARSSDLITARAINSASCQAARMDEFDEKLRRQIAAMLTVLSARALAEAVGVSDSQIRNWRDEGGGLPSGTSLKKAWLNLGLTPPEFLGWAPLPPSFFAEHAGRCDTGPDPARRAAYLLDRVELNLSALLQEVRSLRSLLLEGQELPGASAEGEAMAGTASAAYVESRAVVADARGGAPSARRDRPAPRRRGARRAPARKARGSSRPARPEGGGEP